MQNYIAGADRHQTIFTTLEQQVSADNPVRLMDAFVSKLDTEKLGFTKAVHKSEGRPPYAPAIFLKLSRHWYEALHCAWPTNKSAMKFFVLLVRCPHGPVGIPMAAIINGIGKSPSDQVIRAGQNGITFFSHSNRDSYSIAAKRKNSIKIEKLAIKRK